MRPGGKLIRTLAAYGLTAAALLAFSLTVHAQSRIGSTGGTSVGTSSGMGSSGFGGSGGTGGSSSLGGGSSGFGNNGNGSFSFAGGSSFVGNSSSSFAGGSSSSFSGGSTGGFTGTSSNIGGGGSYGGRNGGGMGMSGVSNMNPFASSFANPLAGGLASANGTSTSTAFGTPLYSNLMTNPTKIVGTNSGSSGGFIGNQRGGMSGLGGSGYGANTGSGTYGIFALPYAPTTANATYPGTPSRPGTVNPAVIPGNTATPAKLTPLPARVQTDLQALIGRSDNISAATRNGLTLGYDAGGSIVLRGTVTSPAEARALESLLRFAPGVSGIRNEMTLKSQ
jgi:hypothetical protein